MASKLADRLRGILMTTPPAASGFSRTEEVDSPPLESILGGEWRNRNGASCFVVERRQDPSTRYGREAVEQIAARLQEAHAEAAIVASAPARAPFVFLDLETTGLSGGAGTYAFIVGCGAFDADGGFVTRQFVLTRLEDERPLLAAVAAELAPAGALVSFNGKSFDAPVLETRHLFHRLEWNGGRIPHLDMLHPARRFWSTSRDVSMRSRQREASASGAPSSAAALAPPSWRRYLQGSPEREGLRSNARDSEAAAASNSGGVAVPDALGRGGASQLSPERESLRSSARGGEGALASGGGAPRELENDGGCSLLALERHVLGAPRVGDVPGSEIPGRYFQFVRSGDARPLAPVLEHNRRDLLSLAGLTARLLHLVRSGPCVARDAGEALALGRVYARAGLEARALGAYEQAVAMSSSTWHESASTAGGGVSTTGSGLSMTRGGLSPIGIIALRSLALALRRARRFDAAAACWRRLLAVGDCPRPFVREATEALAIHHEHRARDLVVAKTFALRALEHEGRPAWSEAVHHRLARIERKIRGASKRATLDLNSVD